jgi:hypothetical protein
VFSAVSDSLGLRIAVSSNRCSRLSMRKDDKTRPKIAKDYEWIVPPLNRYEPDE